MSSIPNQSDTKVKPEKNTTQSCACMWGESCKIIKEALIEAKDPLSGMLSIRFVPSLKQPDTSVVEYHYCNGSLFSYHPSRRYSTRIPFCKDIKAPPKKRDVTMSHYKKKFFLDLIGRNLGFRSKNIRRLWLCRHHWRLSVHKYIEEKNVPISSVVTFDNVSDWEKVNKVDDGDRYRPPIGDNKRNDGLQVFLTPNVTQQECFDYLASLKLSDELRGRLARISNQSQPRSEDFWYPTHENQARKALPIQQAISNAKHKISVEEKKSLKRSIDNSSVPNKKLKHAETMNMDKESRFIVIAWQQNRCILKVTAPIKDGSLIFSVSYFNQSDSKHHEWDYVDYEDVDGVVSFIVGFSAVNNFSVLWLHEIKMDKVIGKIEWDGDTSTVDKFTLVRGAVKSLCMK